MAKTIEDIAGLNIFVSNVQAVEYPDAFGQVFCKFLCIIPY